MPTTPILEEKTAIEVRNLSFFYGTFKGLMDINLNIAEHKVTAFIGPSGCGKSTLLPTSTMGMFSQTLVKSLYHLGTLE